MKFTILILIFVTCFFAGSLTAHQAHYKKKINEISQKEVVVESKSRTENTGICSAGIPDYEDKCCCSDEFCSGPGSNKQSMTCKNHCEDLSSDINLTYQTTKNQISYSSFFKINIQLLEIDHRCTKSSLKGIFHNTPTYISLQALLI